MIFVCSSLLVHKLITKQIVYVFRATDAPCFPRTFCYVRNFGNGCYLGTVYTTVEESTGHEKKGVSQL